MKNKFNGIFIILGSSIGAGILGMPITCSLAGFIPSTILMILIALYMTETAKIIAHLLYSTQSKELNEAFNKTLPKHYCILSIIIYVLLFTTILSAYISKSSDILQTLIENITTKDININLIYIFVVSLTIITTLYDNNKFNKTNKTLTITLIIIFIFLILNSTFKNINIDNLNSINLNNIKYVYPILITSFGFHNIIAYLCTGIKKKKINYIINVGVLLTFIIYFIWLFFIISLKNNYIKLGEIETYSDDKIITDILIPQKNKTLYYILINIFSLIAIFTTIFSIVISMKIFITKIFKNTNKIFIILLTLVPAILIIKTGTNIFFTGLEISGGILTLIIFGLLPIKSVKNIEKKENLFKINFLYIITILIIIISVIIQLTKLK